MGVDQIDGPAYIAGPMTGIVDYNFPAFGRCEALLKRAYPGLEIENPTKNGSNGGEPGSQTYGFYFREGLKQLVRCKSIILLPGFSNSKGATEEYRCAQLMEMTIFVYDDDGENTFFIQRVGSDVNLES